MSKSGELSGRILTTRSEMDTIMTERSSKSAVGLLRIQEQERARSDYARQQKAQQEKTARLRALRLAKEAADRKAADQAAAAKGAIKKPVPKTRKGGREATTT
jgi:hypothetical protein